MHLPLVHLNQHMLSGTRLLGETTLETSGEDVTLHSKRVRKIRFDTLSIDPSAFISIELFSIEGTEPEDFFLPDTVKGIFATRFECDFSSSPLVSSVVFHLRHSFRVWFFIFSTRFECGF